jgi:hypothetical protein
VTAIACEHSEEESRGDMPSGEQNLNRLLLYYNGSTEENHYRGHSV